MAEPTEGIGAATGSRRGAISPQNAREGRAQRDTSGKHTGMRKRAGTTILNADGDNNRSGWGNNRNGWGTTTETDGNNNDNSRAYKKPQDCSLCHSIAVYGYDLAAHAALKKIFSRLEAVDMCSES